jgi:HD-GYP domain-containing protein (c-di-GMP phosphodiesterase class II)
MDISRSKRFRRLFHRQVGLVLVTVTILTAIHFVLAAGGLGWLATNVAFVSGLVIAGGVLIWSVRLVGRETEMSFRDLQASYLNTVRALSSALDARDQYTGTHADSVTRMVDATGQSLGMSATELQALSYAAQFHDIGKIGVSDSILNKPGKLTPAEWETMKRHPVIGAEILAPLEFMAPALPIVRHEHEHWDGSGYPDGLSGEEIPLGARVILVCDAYDAMTTDRPYRAALPRDEAISRLRAGAGGQFDPRVVEVFLEELDLDPAPVGRSAAHRPPELIPASRG